MLVNRFAYDEVKRSDKGAEVGLKDKLEAVESAKRRLELEVHRWVTQMRSRETVSADPNFSVNGLRCMLSNRKWRSLPVPNPHNSHPSSQPPAQQGPLDPWARL
jgi:hypothetical protein